MSFGKECLELASQRYCAKYVTHYSGLWGFLSEWRKLFDRFDVDRSGNISLDEFTDALIAFGYRLSNDYVKLLFNTFDVRQKGVLSFDLFVQACISLKRMTDVFKKYDEDRDGYITLSLSVARCFAINLIALTLMQRAISHRFAVAVPFQ